MDARNRYVKKRNILCACILLLAALAALFFVFRSAYNSPADASGQNSEALAGELSDHPSYPASFFFASSQTTADPSEEPEDPSAGEPDDLLVPILYYGDTRLGAANDSLDPRLFESDLNTRMGEDLQPDCHAYIRDEETDEPDTPYEQMMAQALQLAMAEETDACCLYVENRFIFAAADQESAEGALDSFLAAAAANFDSGETTVELRGVTFSTCRMAKGDLLGDSEMEALLARCCNEKLLYSDVNYDKIERYASDIDFPEDSYVIVKEELHTETIVTPFETKAVYDHEKYAGYTEVLSEGKAGHTVLTYALIYENGVLTERVVRSEVVENEPVDRVVVYGDRQYLLWPVAFPTNVRITSPYGTRVHPIYKNERFHSGIDIAGPSSGDIFRSDVFAALDGVVTEAVIDRGSSGYGTYLVIDHGTIDGKRVSTLYAHCDELLVKQGASVKKGQKIALVGSTGASTGPHLHFEVLENGATIDPLSLFYVSKVNGKPFDPMNYIKKAY